MVLVIAATTVVVGAAIGAIFGTKKKAVEAIEDASDGVNKSLEKVNRVVQRAEQALQPTVNQITIILDAVILFLLVVALMAAKYAHESSIQFTGNLGTFVELFLAILTVFLLLVVMFIALRLLVNILRGFF